MDILELNSKIQLFIEKETIIIDGFRNKIAQIDMLLNNGCSNLRNGMICKLKNLKEDLTIKIEEHENSRYFHLDVSSLTEKYHNLNNQIMVIPFFNSNRKQLKEHHIQKEQIKKDFVKKLKEYHFHKKFKYLIDNGGNALKTSPPPCICGNKNEFIRDDDRAVCAICSTEQSLISNISSFSDVGRVNMASKYTYNRKVHFRDCIIQYQGKQKTNIPEEIYTIIETKLIEKGIVVENATRVMVLDILKELNSKDIKKYYDDIVLIHHNLTGQPCDNIEYLEDALLEDFDKLTETYDNLYTNDDDVEVCKRKNFINSQFVLYQLLKKHGHPCNEMDFFLKISERKRFHHTICKKLFNHLNWKYSYSI